MKYLEIRKYLEKLKVFSVNQLKLIDDNFNKTKIHNWEQKGYIKQIRRGFYMIGDLKLNDNYLFFIANKVYNPSYISLETALSYYQIIPETVYQITSVSSKKTYKFDFNGINFSYKTINSKLFFGYKIVDFGKKSFFIGELEKVLLDYFYLDKNIKSVEDFEELRFNKEVLKKNLNEEKIFSYLEVFGKKFLEEKVKILLNYIKKG